MHADQLDDLKKDLTKIEETILANQAPYNDSQVADLYSSVKLLRQVMDVLALDMHKLNNVFDQAYNLKVIRLIDMVRKLKRISVSQVYPSVFDSINEEIGELHSQVIDSEYEKHRKTQTESENKELKAELNQYKNLIKNVEKQAVELNRRTEQVENIAQSLTASVEDKTSQEWADEYYKYVSYESSFKPISYRSKAKNSLRLKITNVFIWTLNKMKSLYAVGIADTFLYRGHSYNNLSRKWQSIRSLWLLFLFVLAVVYLLSLWSYDYGSTNLQELFFEKSKYLPLVAVVTIGFTFASRNHKINAHLLEQYKHRYVVAMTMNNLMKLDSLKDERITMDLIQLGSKVLFEFKNSGYMNKTEIREMPMGDAVDLISRKITPQ